MLVELKRMVAYICPVCSNIATKTLSVFNFSGRNKVSLICPTRGCHETCAVITQKNSKYKISIECPLCGDTHVYTISREAFWKKQLISYKCPAAGIDMFFVGNRQCVEYALDEYSEIYSDLAEYPLGDTHEEPFALSNAIMGCLDVLYRQSSISCACGSTDIELRPDGDCIYIECRKCGSSKKMDISEDTLMRVLNTSAIVIDTQK